MPVKRFRTHPSAGEMANGAQGNPDRRRQPLVSSRNYQKLIAEIEGKPEERILSYLMLRSLRQARYSDR